MKKAKVIFEVVLMFTVGFVWYAYLTAETVVWNIGKNRRKKGHNLDSCPICKHSKG